MRDYRKRLIVVDNAGVVRVLDSKSIQFKKGCAGNAQKSLKLNETRDKVYYVSASDRSRVIEYDLKSSEFKHREIKFKQGKIIDIEVADDGNSLVTLNKDGVVQIRDLRRKEWMPPKKKSNKDKDMEDSGVESEEEEQVAEDGSIIKKDVTFELQPIDAGRFFSQENKDDREIQEFSALSKISDTTMVAFGFKHYPKVQKKPVQGDPKPAKSTKDDDDDKEYVENIMLSFQLEGEPAVGKIKNDLKVEGDKCRID